MGKKRKIGRSQGSSRADTNKYATEEKFQDSEDEFYSARDKILLEEEPAAKRKRVVAEQGISVKHS